MSERRADGLAVRYETDSMFGWIQKLFGRKQHPLVSIAALKVGETAAIEGEALALDVPLPAPFSGLPAATLTIDQQAVIEQQVEVLGRSSRRHWQTINDLDFGQRFYVRDETGIVRVDRLGWSALRGLKQRGPKRPTMEDDQRIDAFRAAARDLPGMAQVEQEGFVGNFERRVFEHVVPEGARVRVIGVAHATGELAPTGKGGGYRDAPTILELRPGDDFKLSIEVL